MVVPEKSQKVTKIVLPSYVFKGGILTAAFLGVLAAIMVLDYANVMNQINENKQLKVENRQLRQSVQVFKTKMVTIENTLDRVKTFVTKLRIITNIEETGGPTTPPPLPQNLQVPTNLSAPMATPVMPTNGPEELKPKPPDAAKRSSSVEQPELDSATAQSAPQATPAAEDTYETARSRRLNLLASLMTETPNSFTITDADNSAFVRAEFEKLDAAHDEVNKFAIASEQEAQFILERVSEKRALLASTPTRIPTLGYITSDYGIRPSPFDGQHKMHEGIDIANRFGADVIAAADGVVTFAGVKPGYGKIVVIDHGNGIETRYAHNSRVNVQAADKVRRGQRIAAVGNTGHSTGPHCHYEVHAQGLAVDPCPYILDHPGLCRRREQIHHSGNIETDHD